jgi:hypothetical protein
MSVDLQQIALNTIPSLIPNLVIGFVSGGLSAWLTYRLAFRRFRAEKWWERRADAYSDILEALHESLRFAETNIAYMKSGSEVPPEQDADVRKAAAAANIEICRAANAGKLFLSSAALNRLTQFLHDSDKYKPDNWTDYLLTDYEMTSNCIDDFAQLARDDLGTRGDWPWKAWWKS